MKSFKELAAEAFANAVSACILPDGSPLEIAADTKVHVQISSTPLPNPAHNTIAQAWARNEPA